MAQQQINGPRHSEWFSERTKVKAGISAFQFSGQAAPATNLISLNFGLPDEKFFQIPELPQAVGQVLAPGCEKALQYGGASGTRRLPQYIAERYTSMWGVSLDSDEVLITSGSSQAFDLIGRLFLNPGDEVWVEEPTYFGALHVFTVNGGVIRGFPMDEQGLMVDLVEQTLQERSKTNQPMPKLFYSIPNYHNPTGLTMSSDRRQKLAQLAMSFGFYIVEDDAYGELGFSDLAQRHVKAMAPDHTLYLSTFSKTIAPGFRVGYVVAPAEIIRALASVKAEGGTSGFVQEIMANLLQTMDYGDHVKNIRARYKSRCEAMVSALESVMPAGCTWTVPSGGFFIWVTMPESTDTMKLWDYAVNESVSFVGGPPFYVSQRGRNQMRLSFSYYPEDVIQQGIFRLGHAVSRYLQDWSM